MTDAAPLTWNLGTRARDVVNRLRESKAQGVALLLAANARPCGPGIWRCPNDKCGKVTRLGRRAFPPDVLELRHSPRCAYEKLARLVIDEDES